MEAGDREDDLPLGNVRFRKGTHKGDEFRELLRVRMQPLGDIEQSLYSLILPGYEQEATVTLNEALSGGSQKP